MTAYRKYPAALVVAGALCAVTARADRIGKDQAVLMRMAMIQIQEEKARNALDENERKTADAMVRVLFREMTSDFELKDLSEYALVRIGEYLRTKTSTPEKALVYYDEAIGREDQTYLFHALRGRADVYGLSPEVKDMDKAIGDFTRIYEESPGKPMREYALFRKIGLLMKKKEYANADEWARIYLDRNKHVFAKFSPQVNLMLAQSLDKRNRTEDAIAMYAKIWSVHMVGMKISIPALTRWMELIWDRNKPGDRQIAYEKGVAFIGLTSRFKDKLTEEELGMFAGVEKLVRTYEADPGIRKIVSMEEIRRAKE